LEALEYYRRVIETRDLKISLYEKVNSVEKENNSFIVHTDKKEYRSKNVIIATGFFDVPNKLNIPGEELPKVTHYYKEPHSYAFRNVLVIGGGNSAVDAALEIYRKGGKVIMVLEKDDIDESVKYWVRPDIINRIKEGAITVYRKARVVEIHEKTVTVHSGNETFTLENDAVLAMTGYRSDFDFLKKAGVKITESSCRTPVFDEETHQTNIEGLYIAGVVCSGLETHRWYIENSRIHADKIIGHLKHQG
jgi:putative YpdA family bacillithiol system oxidoreductase